MKKIIWASTLLSVLSLVAAGQVQAASYPLYAWGTTEVGSVDVTSDGTDIFVTFNTTGGWALVSTAIHAAGTLDGIPHTRWGNPAPWRFAGQHGWVGCEDSDGYSFPIGNFGGQDFYVAAYAVVAHLSGNCLQIAAAWAGDCDFPAPGDASCIAIPASQWTTSGGSGWNVTGNWTFWMVDGWYQYDLTLAQDAAGNITGSGWVMTADVPPQQDLPIVVTAGNVTDSAVSMTIADAADTSACFTIIGTIADNGTLSGTCPELGDWTWWSGVGTAQQGGSGGAWILP